MNPNSFLNIYKFSRRYPRRESPPRQQYEDDQHHPEDDDTASSSNHHLQHQEPPRSSRPVDSFFDRRPEPEPEIQRAPEPRPAMSQLQPPQSAPPGRQMGRRSGRFRKQAPDAYRPLEPPSTATGPSPSSAQFVVQDMFVENYRRPSSSRGYHGDDAADDPERIEAKPDKLKDLFA